MLEIKYLGNDDGVMDDHEKRGRRHSAEEKALTRRIVRKLRDENESACRAAGANPVGLLARLRANLGDPSGIDEGKREGALRILLLKFFGLSRHCWK